MSDQTEHGGTAVKALAAAAATSAATYAVRRALATRNGHDLENADDQKDEDAYADDEAEDETEASADDSEAEEPDEEADDEDGADHEQESEDSADEDEEDEENDDEEEEAREGSSGKGSLREMVSPARLASLSPVLLPLAGQAAGSAGRYVAEHTSGDVQKQVVDKFIDAYKKAS